MNYHCKTCFYLALEEMKPNKHFDLIEMLEGKKEKLHHQAIYANIQEEILRRSNKYEAK